MRPHLGLGGRLEIGTLLVMELALTELLGEELLALVLRLLALISLGDLVTIREDALTSTAGERCSTRMSLALLQLILHPVPELLVMLLRLLSLS